jgi:hypothetical protein
MRTIITRDGEKYEGATSQFEDKEDHVVFAYSGTRYRIYKVNIASDKEDSGCYVATYAYASADAPQVAALRQFRDDVLMKGLAGRLFVRAYYAWLSALAIRVIGALGEPARALTRSVLDAIARWSQERLGR